MTTNSAEKEVAAAFDRELLTVRFDQIAPLYIVTPQKKASTKYKQIAASIHEIGLVEPIVVAPDKHEPNQYTLLDGHLRLEVLKDRGHAETQCLISTDDEAFTYNKRINRLATIQEHDDLAGAVPGRPRGAPGQCAECEYQDHQGQKAFVGRYMR
jgi:hypothetical protein